jgi:hypothetical protein
MEIVDQISSVPSRTEKNHPIGKRRGRLTVIGYAHVMERGRGRWKTVCKCDCGEEVVTRIDMANSCGCLQREAASRMGKEHGGWKLLPEGEAAFRFLLREYEHQAVDRHLEFHLTPEQFRALTKNPCAYCGVREFSVVNRPELNGPYRYNGVDRVDSLKGYTASNTVSCCSVCNRAKFTRSQKEFVEWLRRAADYCRGLQATTV